MKLKHIGWVPVCVEADNSINLGLWIGSIEDSLEQSKKQMKQYTFATGCKFKFKKVYIEDDEA